MTPAQAIVQVVQFAELAGLPLPERLIVTVPGDDDAAAEAMDGYAAAMDEYGISYTTDHSDLRRALVVHCGAGVTFRMIHTLRTCEGVPA